jgi:hypothetical protein
MHYRVARWLQSLLLAGVVVLFPPAIAAAPLSFQATINFSEQVIPTDTGTPCFAMGTITGSGTATKIGAVTVTSTDCINPLPPAFTSFGFASHNVVLTASNGDHLWALYAGILSAEGRITGSYVVYGGTGRFAHAVGAGTLGGFEAIDLTTGAGNGQITLRGVLAY